ncbi:MAG: PD40 domain-containing protein [Gemmatimonadetes bacterium]|nr:PD40 domain-containing protein [Gemmatimonadota bacterium]
MSTRSVIRRALLGAAVLCAVASTAGAQTKLLRFPAIHGDRVAFTFAGDIWTAPSAGGTATRITAHPGIEVFAHFSPDGKYIAFTGQYDGDEQVYVVPSTGGVPKQLTFYPARGPLTPRWGWDNQVYGWTPDGKKVIFRSGRESWTMSNTRLFTVSMNGGPSEPLPMPEAGAGDLNADGSQVVYSPIFRDFRPEKRYGGGMANDLFIFNTKTNDAKRFVDDVRSDRDPMWIANTIYFNSDRSGTFNLYAYDIASAKTTPVTKNTVWDVRWPSSDHAGRIVYELNGELQVFDTKAGKNTALSISVPDDGLWKRPSRVSVARNIESFAVSPKGERMLVTARGDIFTVPIEKGPTRNLTRSSGAHDREAEWSPDGARIAFISDKTGEEELYVVDQMGDKAPEQLTNGGSAQRFGLQWSPDGKRIAFRDKDGKLYYYSFDDKKVTTVASTVRGQIGDYEWSPKGGFLAFSIRGDNGNGQVFIWSPTDKQLHAVTDGVFNAYNPAWDKDGNYLYFLSDRDFAPQIARFEYNYAANRTTGIFAAALRKNVTHPFPPQSDEAAVLTDGAGAKPAAGEFSVDFDRLGARIARVPVEADNIGGLGAMKGSLVYATSGAGFNGRAPDRPRQLKLFTFKDRKVTTLVENVGGWVTSADGAKIIASTGGQFALYDATPAGANSRKAISTAGLVVDRVPTEEWKQIFHEVWRRYRDYFYVGNMHGFDWAAIGKRYEGWLPFVAHRSDLNYVIQEMISELTVQHTYIEGGDFEIPARVPVALAGARFALDPASGAYRIAKIYQGQNEEPIYRAPLTEVGVNVAEGEYVLAVDGAALRADEDPYALLRGKADRPVQLTVNSKPSLDGARMVTFNPVTSESDLAYLDWTQRNRAMVDKLSGGRLGYMHIPDMGAPGIREFIKWYYPQLDKEALVVDVRANGGGNVSRMLIERLRRKVLGVNYGRVGSSLGNTYPDGVFMGPMAAILDERSSSDGDIFPYMFKQAGLGLLVGRRSWGGVVGIGGGVPLIDGGSISVPGSGLASPDGKWVIEGYGVDPDINVENDPKSQLAGHDNQLERAVAELMKQLQGKKVKLPPMPAGPNKKP